MAKPTKHGDKWRIRWSDHNGRRRSEVHTTYKAAQKALSERHVAVEAVRRGEQSPEPEPRDFNSLCDYWLEHRVARKRSRRHDESIIRAHLRPAFGCMDLRRIGVAEIDAFMSARQHLAANTVRNHVRLLLAMLRVALDLKQIRELPRVQVPKQRLFDRDFRYLRNAEEVRRFLRAARDDGQDGLTLYATAIFTGLRQGELAALQWADIDLDRRQTVVQRSFSGPTKGGDVRYVLIVDDLLPILRDWRLKAGGSWLVFPNERGNMQQRGARIFKQRFHRVLDAAGFPRPPADERAVHYINFHGLRHTFASHWVMDGGDLFKLQKILGHKTVQMTMRYAHLQPSAFVEDYGRMTGLVPGDGAQVEPLGAAGGVAAVAGKVL
jgi:integrase